MLEKKLDEKYFFIMEKFYFEKKSMTFFLKSKKIFSPKFPTKKYFEKIKKKIRIFCKKNSTKIWFFVDFFLAKNLIFFHWKSYWKSKFSKFWFSIFNMIFNEKFRNFSDLRFFFDFGKIFSKIKKFSAFFDDFFCKVV